MRRNFKRSVYLFIFMGILTMLTNSCKKDDNKSNQVIDLDGNIYHIVTIGTQVWMVENLKVTKYRNGDPIPAVTDGTAWSLLSTGAFCNYNNLESNGSIYGKLYNWYAVNDSRNIAPTGWHVPTNDDWLTLETFLGGQTVAGGKMKTTGTTYWGNPNTGATNESGFSGLPGGLRTFSGTFMVMESGGYWWSSTSADASSAFGKDLFAGGSWSHTIVTPKGVGYSVRCVKD